MIKFCELFYAPTTTDKGLKSDLFFIGLWFSKAGNWQKQKELGRYDTGIVDLDDACHGSVEKGDVNCIK